MINFEAMEDSYTTQGKRKRMIDLLRSKGIEDEQVLSALEKIPRHLFFDKIFHHKWAYDDIAFPIGAGQTISQPYTVAFQTALLKFSKGMKILEIGTGSGYQTAVLCELGGKVFSIERQLELYQKTKTILPKMGYKANLYFGDGYVGKEAFAPFDRILVTCGAPYIPDVLIDQLALGGRMVIPLGEGKVQEMILIEKTFENEIVKTSHGDFSFVPMLSDKQY